jgi:hypothetical protein
MRPLKAVLAGSAVALIAGAAFAAASPATPAPDARPKLYVGEFCGPIALSDSGTDGLMQHLNHWDAKGQSDTLADAVRPQDSDAPGQLFRFPDLAAPFTFVDRRRGVCSLIYPTARAPDAVLSEMATEALPIGDKGAAARWRKVSRSRFGPPGPLRYFLKVGENEGFGLCTTIFEDLRLRNGSPVTMVRVSTCRLGPDEKLDNG